MKRGPSIVAVLLGLTLSTGLLAPAQQPPFSSPLSSPFSSLLTGPYIPPSTQLSKKERKKAEKEAARKLGQQPSIPPSITIPVVPLGFAQPSVFDFSYRVAQLTLDFLDENTILFTFRVPMLIPRDRTQPNAGSERRIRAVVLSLPTGQVTAEALWSVHDYRPYVWALKDGKFLFRDQNQVQTGNSSLKLTPYLRFPGPVRSLQLSPSQELLIANSTEPQAPKTSGDPDSPMTPSSSAASIHAGTDPPNPNAVSTNAGGSNTDQADGSDTNKVQKKDDTLLRIFRMDTGKVVLFTRVSGVTHIPLDGEGYYEALRGKGISWLITYQHFQGATNTLLQIESVCSPALSVPAPSIVLASGCNPNGGRRLVAINQDKQRLWDISLPATQVWPILALSTSGTRIARSTLEVRNPIGPSSPIAAEDVRGQLVQVYDLYTGKLALTAPTNPPLDGGGNFALSPSGNRAAVLNQGQIQIFDLPPASSPSAK